ncbi:hypothetical protein NDU88_004808 [Pleurodeles waltl]|uniref:Uncharacterized protein n=1 Tax=Pleurodeles waltl TaxID=8319 RepID=A0AAV7NND6_PLEWA|nr:hypothetical protein NDU88_004808 [Pleurodeles waltl]
MGFVQLGTVPSSPRSLDSALVSPAACWAAAAVRLRCRAGVPLLRPVEVTALLSKQAIGPVCDIEEACMPSPVRAPMEEYVRIWVLTLQPEPSSLPGVKE